jgi:vacuolar-type H+-ATPase subunit E/Vma4
MEITGDTEGLLRAVRELARQESDAIISAAQAEAGKMLASAAEAAQRAGLARMEAALAEAARLRALLLASVPGEAARYRRARDEAVLDSIKSEAARRLAGEGGGVPCLAAALAGLAARAVGAMEGTSFVLTLPSGGAAELRGLAGEIERQAGKGGLELVFEEDPAVTGGVVARDAEGRQFWDNSFTARLDRLWPELRGGLAGLLREEK